MAEDAPRLSPFERRRRTIGLFAGPALFALLLVLPPAGVSYEAGRLLAVLAWVLAWWVTEPVPIPVTALLGPALAVVSGVGKASELFAGFGDPIVFLFLGSFVLAGAMVATGLDRRFALAVLSSPWVGSSSWRLLAGFGAVTAGLSMFLSNTATAAMMCPIAMGVLSARARLLDGRADLAGRRDARALLLATAYAASIGGIGTPIGTPPNLIALGQLEAIAGVRITFFQWTVVGIPLVVILMAVLVGYLRWALPPEQREVPGGRELVLRERAALGPLARAERNVLLAFGTAVVLWILPGAVALAAGTAAPLSRTVQRLFPEGVVALLAASLLFVLPVSWKARRFTLGWEQASRIDWGTLMLFGSGLSLGAAMGRTGLAEVIGGWIVRGTGATSLAGLTFLFCGVAIVLTETTSNTAAATMVCPLAIAASQAAGVSPVPPTIAAAIGASAAYMLPVSTPPNAIVYGTGCVPITAMLRHGSILDVFTLLLTPGLVLLLCALLGL